MAIIETRDLAKHYRLGSQLVRAVDGVSIAIEQGELVAIVGRSGSGKSTLLHLIGCLDRPTSGTVAVNGIDVGSAPDARLHHLRRHMVGFVFQQFNLIPTLTALQNVMLPLRYARAPAKDARRRAEEVLGLVEMSDRLDHRPTTLSGGEQQRVAIARALANRPAIVLADEPTGELDTQTAASIAQLLERLNQDMGQTLLIVTHDLTLAAYARRVIRLKDGRIESDLRNGPPAGA